MTTTAAQQVALDNSLDEVYPSAANERKAQRGTVDLQLCGESGKQVSGTQTANLQNLSAHENNDWRISVHDRLGNRDVHSRLGQRRSSSESPPSSDSEDSRRKRRRRVSVSSEDTSDNEDAETGHWKSKNRYREDEDMSLPWRRQKVDAFARRISDFSEDKRRRMPANVKTYDGTGDPDDHLKIFESAATIENWPQPVWCHMFNSTLVGNARNWFSKLPRRSIDGFEELRRAFRLNFTQRKKCAKNPVELARVKQRQGESTSVYMERYKDECIHVKACPEILKISGFMNGINNPELIKRLNDRVPQTFDELMKRTRSFIQGEAAAADSRKGYSNNRSQEHSRRQSNDQSSSRNNNYRSQRGGRGNDKYTPLTMTPKEILATEGSNFPKPPPMRTPEEQRAGNGYCEYHRQKGHTTNECFLASVMDTSLESPNIENLSVVREFADVFPDELPGLPPAREIEFGIELIPGAEPISKAPALDVELCVRVRWLLAVWRYESNLMLQIKEAQRKRRELVGYSCRMLKDVTILSSSVDDDGVVWFEDMLCVPNDQALREKVIGCSQIYIRIV
ncbi:reverse transcriptase domain-containing protein [Tanacetum coccineum]